MLCFWSLLMPKKTVIDETLKLHHLQVIRATPLERLYHQGQVVVFNLDDYLRLLMLLSMQ